MKSSKIAKKCAKQKYLLKTEKSGEIQPETGEIGRKRAVSYFGVKNIFSIFTLKKR